MAAVGRAMLLRHVAAPAFRASTSLRSASVFRHPTIRQSILRRSAGITAFHTTSPNQILPPPPQVIEGGVNEPAPVPPRSPSHGSYHWTLERTVAAGLVPLTLAPFAGGSVSPYLDAVLCAAILIHSHIGFQSIIIDYIPKMHFPLARKLFWWALNAGTILVGIGLYEFETTDVGITEAVKRIWKA